MNSLSLYRRILARKWSKRRPVNEFLKFDIWRENILIEQCGGATINVLLMDPQNLITIAVCEMKN